MHVARFYPVTRVHTGRGKLFYNTGQTISVAILQHCENAGVKPVHPCRSNGVLVGAPQLEARRAALAVAHACGNAMGQAKWWQW